MKDKKNKKRECPRCGCDFPNIPIYENYCANCEIPEELYDNSMRKLMNLLDESEVKRATWRRKNGI